MKKILTFLFALVSIAAYSQTNTFGGIGLRVNDTTTYQTNAVDFHTAGYYDIYFNNQATNDHWDVWNGSSYDHIFAFGQGSGTVSDVAYAASWDGVTTIAPSKNAVYDKIETIVAATTLTIPITDQVTAISATAGKWTIVMPTARTLTSVTAYLITPQASGSIFTVDINENGTTILSTKLTIDNTEDNSSNPVTPAVISDSSLAQHSEISFDVDQIGNGSAVGLIMVLTFSN